MKIELNKSLTNEQFALQQPPGAEVMRLDNKPSKGGSEWKSANTSTIRGFTSMMNKMIVANLAHRPMRSLISIVAIALEVTLILLIVGPIARHSQ